MLKTLRLINNNWSFWNCQLWKSLATKTIANKTVILSNFGDIPP